MVESWIQHIVSMPITMKGLSERLRSVYRPRVNEEVMWEWEWKKGRAGERGDRDRVDLRGTGLCIWYFYQIIFWYLMFHVCTQMIFMFLFFNSSWAQLCWKDRRGYRVMQTTSHHWHLMLCVQSTTSQWWERVCATLAILQHLSFTGSHTPPDFKSM